MNNVSPTVHLKSIFLSVFDLIRAPEMLPGNLLETFADWSRHRKWTLIWITTPALVAVIGFIGIGIYSTFRSTSSIVQGSLIKVEKKLPLVELTKLAFNEHYYRNRVKKRPDPLNYYEEATNEEIKIGHVELVADAELVQSAKFRDSEILLRRAIQASPDSNQSRFRLALLTALDTSQPDHLKVADRLMLELAMNEAEIMQPAHAWLAVSLLGKPSQLNPVELIQLEKYLKNASQWKQIEPGLLSMYSSICLQTGKKDRALAMAKLAAEHRPELNLAYAQICKMLGPEYEKEMKRAAKDASEAFKAKLGTPLEVDTDRLGLAEVLLLLGDREQAVEILQTGLTEDPTEHQPIRRGLAELYIHKFRTDNETAIENAGKQSHSNAAKTSVPPSELVASDETGNKDSESTEGPDAITVDEPNEIDWTNLQEAAKYDPDNPEVGQEIAIQWRKLSKKPPPDLIRVLSRQLREDIASSGSRLMIAELYLNAGRVKDAREQWEIVLQKEPYVIPALNNMAVMLSRETPSNLNRAIELIERAYRIQPLSPEICDTYGEVYMNAGHFMDAIPKLEESVRLDMSRLLTRKRLAECYRKLGNLEMAKEQDVYIQKMEEQAAKKNAEP